MARPLSLFDGFFERSGATGVLSNSSTLPGRSPGLAIRGTIEVAAEFGRKHALLAWPSTSLSRSARAGYPVWMTP